MPSAVEECRKPSGNCQGISHCLGSGHPDYNVHVDLSVPFMQLTNLQALTHSIVLLYSTCLVNDRIETLQWLAGRYLGSYLSFGMVYYFVGSVQTVRMRQSCIAAGQQATAPSCARKSIGNRNILHSVIINSSLFVAL